MEYNVTVQLEGQDVSVGTLYQNVRHGEETTSFVYSQAYVQDSRAFALAPDMPLGTGTFHSKGLSQLRAFEDCMPDRWGRNLMLRAERNAARAVNRAERTFFELDYLAGVNDKTRQGALRIWGADGTALAPNDCGVPREVGIPALLDASDRMSEELEVDIRGLVAAGSSLGGARPKASVRDERGRLCIAKFPKADEDAHEDVCAWENVAIQLMSACGIAVPRTRLIRVRGRSVLLLERFDREGDKRIPYISGLTAVQGQDGERHSCLELVEFMEECSVNPRADIQELWLRLLFSSAIGNTDNHLRNYGFLRMGKGWRLSPAFDVNPTPGDGRKYLASSIGFDAGEADPEAAMEACEYYRVTLPDAKQASARMAQVIGGWRKVACSNGISDASIERMATCFDAAAKRLKAGAR